jgi:hypothetical protein
MARALHRGGMTFRGKFSRADWTLTALFLITLPFVRAQIREDGIAYYGVARSIVVDHNLQFRGDWTNAYSPTIEGRDQFGRAVTLHTSKTGRIPVHSAIGASLLWMPFIGATHATVLALDHLGAHIPANGFSEPYRITLAAATCLYAFAGIWLSFRLARQFVDERWAFLATIALWLASSLPAYIYVDPAWSHAHSVFAVALFLWYWNRTRENRSCAQWFVLGLISGLMAEVYFPNVVIALVIVFEAAAQWLDGERQRFQRAAAIRNYSVYLLAVVIALAPTFVIRAILLGSPLAAGAYGNQGWNWTTPAFLQILFSPSQGLLTTTPIAMPAIIGLFLFPRRDKVLGRGLIGAFLALWALIAVYPFWNLGPAFGNRYFISLVPAFILGLAYLLSECAQMWRDNAAFARRAWLIAAVLIVWNIGLLFQWSIGLMPDVGRVYWDQVLYNQFRIVPAEALRALHSSFTVLSKEPSYPDQKA